MRRIYSSRFGGALFTLAILVTSSFPYGLRADVAAVLINTSNSLRQQQPDLKVRGEFARSHKLLMDYGVPFNPNELLKMNWSKRLAAKFALMPELDTYRAVESDRVSGVYVAGTLSLPEKMMADGDLVILARKVIYGGKNVEIIAPGKAVSVFIIESQEHLEGEQSPVKSGGKEGLPTVYIRTGASDRYAARGTGRDSTGPGKERGPEIGEAILAQQGENKDGMNGPPGHNGQPGRTGESGEPGNNAGDGTCTGSRNGEGGFVGEDGEPGGKGEEGEPGFDGQDGGPINYTIPASATGTFDFSAKGGEGGTGGAGGRGGAGGTGGVGGNGGNGASCNDCNIGPGNGGGGGRGGKGGRGGDGGNGGKGGNGGNGGNINVLNLSSSANITANPNGGMRGRGGSGGQPGTSGIGGGGGRGGSAGSTTCSGFSPSRGPDAPRGNSGGTAEFGPRGEEGARGMNGSFEVTRAGGGDENTEIIICVPDNEGFAENCASPIIIDTQGDGIDLSSAPNGIDFDIDGNGSSERLAWTRNRTNDAWLALDRNGNGRIDSGQELFGNFTPQAVSSSPNGFIALAEYDKSQNGGNNDALIDARDGIFSSLKLWLDTNRNGRSEAGEMFTLPSLEVTAFDLDYKEFKRRDHYGNWCRYRAKVYDARGAQLGRWAWDVFLARVAQ